MDEEPNRKKDEEEEPNRRGEQRILGVIALVSSAYGMIVLLLSDVDSACILTVITGIFFVAVFMVWYFVAKVPKNRGKVIFYCGFISILAFMYMSVMFRACISECP